MKKIEIGVEVVAQKIHVVRGRRVLLDSDLAEMYGVKTKVLLQSVKRNAQRFPDDFMYRLTRHEVADLRSQIVTSSWGGKRYVPLVFTEQGIAMLSSVLRSERAIRINIAIMRAFVKTRELLLTHKGLAEKIGELERKYQLHETDIQAIFTAIKKLLEPPPKPRFGVN
jgi:hypothetical protein